MAARCSSCQAEIIWTITASGARMPVDPKPVSKGVVLRANPDDALTPFSRVVDVFVSHFATCPQAARHRSVPPKSKPETAD